VILVLFSYLGNANTVCFAPVTMFFINTQHFAKLQSWSNSVTSNCFLSLDR